VSLAKALLTRTLASGSLAEIPIATANEPGMTSKLTKKGTIRYLPYPTRPREQDFVATSDLRISRRQAQPVIG